MPETSIDREVSIIFEELSWLSISAAALYSFVMLACASASLSAAKARQPGWHWRSFAGLAILFALLLWARMAGFEDAAREVLRDMLKVSGSYDQRRGMQGIIIAIFIIAAAATGMWALYRSRKGWRQRRVAAVRIALIGGGIMAMVMVLRLVSLHAVDKLLYGALKLNWVSDIGSSLTVMCAAIYYTWMIRQPDMRASRGMQQR